MPAYAFHKGYQTHDPLRLSFNQLAKATFGIDFERWYQEGYWSSQYIPYSFVEGQRVISNVSANRMTLMIEGRAHTAIQVGTVMIHPDYRRQGLAKALLERVIEDFKDTCDLFFLAADEEAIPLYQACGFEAWEEETYTLPFRGGGHIEPPLMPLSAKEAYAAKSKALPITQKLSVLDGAYVFMFYWMHGFDHMCFRVDDTLAVCFEMEGQNLILYDVISQVPFDLEDVLKRITPAFIQTITLQFSPPESLRDLVIHRQNESGWMVKAHQGITFPKGAKFPEIAKT